VAKVKLVTCFTERVVKKTHTTEILGKTSWWLIHIYDILHVEMKWEKPFPSNHSSITINARQSLHSVHLMSILGMLIPTKEIITFLPFFHTLFQ
jgi:hypothetical protein